MAKTNLGHLLKKWTTEASSSEAENEQLGFLDTPLSDALLRGTNQPTAVDEGRWLDLYNQSSLVSRRATDKREASPGKATMPKETKNADGLHVVVSGRTVEGTPFRMMPSSSGVGVAAQLQIAAVAQKEWILIDAEGVVLGRLASIIAMRLRGKHKASFNPHVDMCDNVIVINADKVQLRGKKGENHYYWHTGHPGGIRSRSLEGANPERVIYQAVKRMMPGDRLSRQLLTNLRVYAGASHPHEDQPVKEIDVKATRSRLWKRST